MQRYFHLILIRVKAALLVAMQYRFDFLGHGILSCFWAFAALLPLFVLFQSRPVVLGWTWPQALLVVGFFTLLQGLINGWFEPSLVSLVEHVRKGTLDFMLLKPADAQFLISTSKFDVWRFIDVLAGLLLIAYGLNKQALVPHGRNIALAGGLTAVSAVLLYSILLSLATLAFYVVKVDNLSYLVISIYDAARWPGAVFRGLTRILFLVVMPFIVMTTYPALSLLGTLSLGQALYAVFIGTVFLWLTRLFFQYSIRRYTSAGG